MAENLPQNLANHNRFDPAFHFFLLPLILILGIASLVSCFRHPGWETARGLLVVTALAVTAVKARSNALKVQDRVIRLEQRLRLAALLPESLRSQIVKLSEGQLIALRFASDEEVPALAHRALVENLSRGDIKKSIRNWQADFWRV
jgi:Family of unknown function (DUF6526)